MISELLIWAGFKKCQISFSLFKNDFQIQIEIEFDNIDQILMETFWLI